MGNSEESNCCVNESESRFRTTTSSWQQEGAKSKKHEEKVSHGIGIAVWVSDGGNVKFEKKLLVARRW